MVWLAACVPKILVVMVVILGNAMIKSGVKIEVVRWKKGYPIAFFVTMTVEKEFCRK